MPEIRHHGAAWWIEQIVWGLFVGIPVAAMLAMLYWLWQSARGG